MLFVTGDTHGEHHRFLKGQNSTDRLSSGDMLIVCGDFGYIFRGGEKEEEYLDYLSELPFRLLFVDGNHENFDRIRTYPEEQWCGGKTHVIRRDACGIPKVIHLMRGQIFQIEGKKIFTFGGAHSIDRYMRTPGYSWWEEEMPADEEIKEAIGNLKKNNHQVDDIVTHAAPEDTMCLFHSYHP